MPSAWHDFNERGDLNLGLVKVPAHITVNPPINQKSVPRERPKGITTKPMPRPETPRSRKLLFVY
jgi:hypothetical protein